MVGGAPIRASRASAAWCLAGVNQCWTQKARNIRDSERDEARRAYDHAREVYKPSLLNRRTVRTVCPIVERFLTASLLAAPAWLPRQRSGTNAPRPLKIVCVGGHPDDPESGCGGTLALFAAAGHRRVDRLSDQRRAWHRRQVAREAARIRTAEAQRACEILQATPIFAGQIDGATEFNADRIRAFIELLTNERADIVLTHWPVDTHIDHQIASLLAFRAWLAARQSFSLFYFEVNAGEQTRLFLPTEYVDITPVRDQKKRALFAHVSQDGEAIYRDHHGPMEQFRGREIGVEAAEAFVHAARSRLPGI